MPESTSAQPPRLGNALLSEAATLLIHAVTGAARPADCLRVASTLTSIVAARAAPDARKGNPNGGSGRVPDWYIVQDAGRGTFPVRGVAAAAELVGRKEANLRVAISRAGARGWAFTRVDDNGEWGVCVRKATEAEAAELTAEAEASGTKNAG